MNNQIKKRISCLLLATSLIVSGCGLKKSDTKESTPSTFEYTSNNYLNTQGESISLFSSDYTPITEDNKYTLYYKTIIYINNDNSIQELSFDKSQIVTVLETNNEYAKIVLNNGLVGYVEKDLLIKCPNLQKYNYQVLTDNKEKITTSLSLLYNNDGSYAGYVDIFTKCNAIANNGEYTLVSLENGTSAFILTKDLINENKIINGKAIITKDTITFLDKELDKPASYINEGSIIDIIYTKDNYACVLASNGESRYLSLSDIEKDYIVVDISEQKMYCYLDYQLTSTWNTKTGKNSTPTHTGLFDIDCKVKDWEFTTFKGSYAKYWIPINEFGEGIHDLIGDNEANYGTSGYIKNGSHGCIRVPAKGSEFVYDNYHEGNLVLVRK